MAALVGALWCGSAVDSEPDGQDEELEAPPPVVGRRAKIGLAVVVLIAVTAGIALKVTSAHRTQPSVDKLAA